MVTPMRLNKSAVLVAALVLLYSTGASAELSFHDSATNQGILDRVVSEFATRAAGWQSIILAAATRLYWTLVTISMVWTFGMMALRKADIGEFFAEFVRFTIFTGFFWWLLTNGPNFASSIYASLRQLAEGAIGISGISPSGIVNVGFAVWKQALTNLSAWQPIDSLVGLALSAGILLLLATIGINMLLLLVSGWILAYAGIFFLGFGGSRWTSDMAINYYKTVLGVAAQLMTMVLLVGIGNDLLSSFYGQMTKGALNFDELGVMLVFCLALLMLINRVPPLVAGIINGTGVGAAGSIGNFGAGAVAGAALGAAGMAAAAAGKAGAALLGGAANMAGGVSAVKAAFEKAQGSMSGESSMSSMPSMGGSGGGSSPGGGDSGGGSPFAQAAGFGSSSSSSTSTGTKANKSEGGNAKGKSAGSTQGSQAKSASENKPQSASSGGGLAQAVAVTASAAGELAKGAGSVLKNKAAQLAEGFQERVSQTPGGQIASAIRASVQSQDTPAFDGNSLGSDRQADPSDEVAAFVNRSADESSEGSDTVQRQTAGPTFNPKSAFDY